MDNITAFCGSISFSIAFALIKYLLILVHCWGFIEVALVLSPPSAPEVKVREEEWLRYWLHMSWFGYRRLILSSFTVIFCLCGYCLTPLWDIHCVFTAGLNILHHFCNFLCLGLWRMWRSATRSGCLLLYLLLKKKKYNAFHQCLHMNMLWNSHYLTQASDKLLQTDDGIKVVVLGKGIFHLPCRF